jgi:small subunit ribosomal protein S6
MSRKYEGLIVLDTKGMEGSVDDLVSSVAKELEDEGAKLDEVQQLGRRKFAYSPGKVEAGHYVNYIFDADPEAVARMDARLKLNGKVYLQHFQRLD